MRSTQLQSRLTIVTLFDLAPGGVYHAFFVTKKAVSSYLTFSPLPYKFQLRRFIFCGTFPGVAPAGYYPAPLSCGARTICLGDSSKFRFTDKSFGIMRRDLHPHYLNHGAERLFLCMYHRPKPIFYWSHFFTHSILCNHCSC
jgi:hypothetical protein